MGRLKIMRLEEGVIDAQTPIRYKRIKKRRKRTRPKKRRYVVIGICLFLAVASIVLSTVGYPALDNRYHQDLALAHTGEQDLQTAMALIEHDPLNSSSVGTARLHFTKALASFTQLQSDLAPLPDLLASMPAYGARFGAAKHLLPLAITVTQAGLAGCAILSIIAARLHEPLSTKAQGLTMADLAVLHQNLQQLKLILNQAIGQANQLQPEDLQLDPRLSKLVGEFHTRLPLIQNAIGQAEAFLAVAPQVLGIGTPAYYLVEILDSSELRPGGGFIGNYGIATLSGGRFMSAHVIDTYLLDKAFERMHRIPFPPAYSWFPFSHGRWGLRDSNLDADFPTSALNGETHYAKEGGKLPLAGVIAITPVLIEHMLTLTGPIQIPEYHETVTAQNLMDRIHYHQLIEDAKGGDVPSADGYSSVRKHFTALLGEHFLARLHTLPGSTFPQLLQLLLDSMRAKDIQIYFNSSAAEKLLQFYHFDGSIQSPEGDGIFVVDANITPSKANKYLATTLNDQVSIDQAGNAIHHTVIKFTWTVSGPPPNFYGSTLYRAYVRVYMPVNSVLHAQAGWSPRDKGIASGRRFWGGSFSVNYPSMGTITLAWSVAGAASKDTRGWHYLYLLQRQAGAQQQMNLQITFPSCAAIVDTSPGVVKDSKQHAHLTQALTQDTGVRVDYTC
jgi:Protein of unknown function (DUF4012)